MLSPFDSNSSIMNTVDDPEPIDLSPLIKGKSVDILRSKADAVESTPSKFSSFDGDDTEDDLEGDRYRRRHRKLTHSPSPSPSPSRSRPNGSGQRHRKMTHSPRRRDHIVEPAAPFLRRHSNSFSIQKQRPQRLKDRTRSFHQSAARKMNGDLPPNTTALRQRHTTNSIVTAPTTKQSASRSPQPSPRRLRPRPSAVTKRRSFHFVSTRRHQQTAGRVLK